VKTSSSLSGSDAGFHADETSKAQYVHPSRKRRMVQARLPCLSAAPATS
jgi:hypothetical protein